MSMNEPKSIHAAEDWGLVLQSVPSRHKKEIVKRLEEIFGLDKHDAEQVLSNMPLILVDNISFGIAARMKKYFQKLGAVAETTNHEMIKKNCFQIVWPQVPELAFFLKDEDRVAEVPLQEKKPESVASNSSAPEAKVKTPETKPEAKVVPESAPVMKPAPEPPPAPVTPGSTVEEKPAAIPASGSDSDWERRAHELNEKLRKIQDEKEQLREQHVEVTEQVKNEFQQKLEQEKQKRDEIAKAYESLRVQAQNQEALTKEGEAWRSKAMELAEKVRTIETDLMQKNSAIEHLIQQKDDLSAQAEKATALAARISALEEQLASKGEEHAALQSRLPDLESRSEKASDLATRLADVEKTVVAINEEKAALQGRIAELEGHVSVTGHELESSRGREQDLSQKAQALEREVQEVRGALQSRDSALAQFEKQMLELAEKLRSFDALRQEHGQLVQERTTIRREYDAKLVEQEVRLAKIEEEHRRYRSRTDRKNAAATRELGEWVRGVDTVRQGLQKLILFLGSESAVLDTEKKFPLRSPRARGPEAPNSEPS